MDVLGPACGDVAAMAVDLAGADLTGACLIYSLWPGYLNRDRVDLRAWSGRGWRRLRGRAQLRLCRPDGPGTDGAGHRRRGARADPHRTHRGA